jgi:hypothetical protein
VAAACTAPAVGSSTSGAGNADGATATAGVDGADVVAAVASADGADAVAAAVAAAAVAAAAAGAAAAAAAAPLSGVVACGYATALPPPRVPLDCRSCVYLMRLTTASSCQSLLCRSKVPLLWSCQQCTAESTPVLPGLSPARSTTQEIT